MQFSARASAMIQNGNEVVAFGRILVVGTHMTYGPIAWLQVNGGSRHGSLWHGLPLMVGIATLALVLTLQCRTRIGSPELALVVRQKIVRQATSETIGIEIPIITATSNILAVAAEAAKIAPRITAGLTRSVDRGGVHISIAWLSVDRSGFRIRITWLSVDGSGFRIRITWLSGDRDCGGSGTNISSRFVSSRRRRHIYRP